MGRRSKRTTKRQHSFFEEITFDNNDFQARTNGPQNRKNFHVKDLNRVQALNSSQEEVFHSFHNNKNIFLCGSAGTGKSFLAIFLAIRAVLEGEYKKLIIIRSPIPTTDVGFLPGELHEKIAVYESPYVQIFDDLFPWKKTFENLKSAGKVEFIPTSFLRGVTFDNAIIVFDEFQNCSDHEFSTVITRTGVNSRLIICGDVRQSDVIDKRKLPHLEKTLKIIREMPSFDVIEFGIDDIVRSGIVKEYLVAKESIERG